MPMQHIPCNAVVQYLKEHGWAWTKLERSAADHVVWAARDDDRRVVWVPTNRNAGDYGHQMMRVIAALESWEGRDYETIVAEILALHEAVEACRFYGGPPPIVI